jgi:BirA family biotin operon repressor/biotin-[acetyl-CoA-carboxylase] ligase
MKQLPKKKRHGRDARGTEEADHIRLSELRTSIKPFRLHYFSRLRSTNDHAAVMRKRGKLFAPAAVLTPNQTAGRGRGAHAWWSSTGCLTITFVFPIYDHHEPHHIPLLAGLAVRNAAAGLAGDDSIQLKWPNDVVYHGRKLAGLLCERVARVDLVGIGLNVNVDPATAPLDLRRRVTSLSQIAGKPLDMTRVSVQLAQHLHAMLSHRPQHPAAHFLKQYDEHHSLIGRNVTVLNSANEPAITGICQGLDAIGRLLLRDRNRLHHIISGQVIV